MNLLGNIFWFILGGFLTAVMYFVAGLLLAPEISSSTRQERLAFIREEFRCLHNCEICGRSVHSCVAGRQRRYMQIILREFVPSGK